MWIPQGMPLWLRREINANTCIIVLLLLCFARETLGCQHAGKHICKQEIGNRPLFPGMEKPLSEQACLKLQK